MKFVQYQVTFIEIPDEINLVFSISNCKNFCKGCHSPFLQEDIGTELTDELLCKILSEQKYVTCVVFFGGDQEEKRMVELLKICIQKGFKTALYTGKEKVSDNIRNHLNYLKTGSYDVTRGGLSSGTTNQKMTNVKTGEDITYRFFDRQ